MTESRARTVRRLAWIPGLAHLLLDRRQRGAHLLGFTALMLLVLVGRWHRLIAIFAGTAVDQWVAAIFVCGSIVGTVMFSRWDTNRVLKSVATTAGKSPIHVAWHR